MTGNYFGLVEPQTGAAGAAVVEMVAVGGAVAAMIAAAIPAFTNTTANTQRATCRNNMQAIANAEHEYKLKDAGMLGHTPAYANTIAMLRTKVSLKVACPSSNGAYSIQLDKNGGGAFTVHCTCGLH